MMSSSSIASPLSLCLTTTTIAGSGGGQQQQQRKVISIDSSSSTQDLYHVAQEAFDNQKEIAALRFGFPPKLLEKNTTTPIHTILSNHERIQVEFSISNVSSSAKRQRTTSKKETVSKKSLSNSKQIMSTTDAPSPHLSANTTPTLNSAAETNNNNIEEQQPKRRPSQRAAAKAATESFAASIQAQEQQQQQPSPKTTTTRNRPKNSKRPRTTTGSSSNSNKNSNTNGHDSSSPIRSNTRYFRQTALEAGRRLGDGAAVVEANNMRPPPSSNRTTTTTRKTAPSVSWKTEDDISASLMSALNQSGGGGGGKVGTILRKAMRNAVSQSYEASRAVVRVAAITGHAYTLTTQPTVDTPLNNNDNDATTAAATTAHRQPEKLHVTYDKGVEGRGQMEDTVDYIPKDALVAVITAIHQSDPEALRPTRIAQLSPRVLWSLMYHTTTTASAAEAVAAAAISSEDPPPPAAMETLPSCVEEALQMLLPDLDWTYMKARKRELSEKARENLRQRLEREKAAVATTAGENGDVDDDDAEENEVISGENLQKAQETILAVQNAMESIHDWDSQQRRNRLAQAAMARFGSGGEPNATDNSNNNDDDENDTATDHWMLVTPTESDEDELVACIKPTAATLFGNGSEREEEEEKIDEKIQQIVKALMDDCQIHNWRELANASVPDLVQRLHAVLPVAESSAAIPMSITLQIVESWVDHAQDESVEEIIVEICDGHVDAVERLRDAAQSGTPKDLAAWRHIPQMLWNEAGLAQLEQPAIVTVESVVMWCQRAHQLLQEYEWLQWYATPLE